MRNKKEMKQLEAFEHEDVKLPDERTVIETVQEWFDSGMNGNILDLFPIIKHLSVNGVNRMRLYLIHLIIVHCRVYPQDLYNDRMIFEAINNLSIKLQREVVGLK